MQTYSEWPKEALTPNRREAAAKAAALLATVEWEGSLFLLPGYTANWAYL